MATPIRPEDLPAKATVAPTAAIIFDDGTGVYKGTPENVVDPAIEALLEPSTGATRIGSDDGASGSLWTTVAGFITYLKSSAGASVPGFIQSGTGAQAETAQAALRRLPIFPGQYADGLTDALATGKNVALDATISTQGETIEDDYQSILGLGNAILAKNANGTLLTMDGRGSLALNLQVEGNGAAYTGDNLEITGPDAMLHGCTVLNAENRAVKATAGNTQVVGGLYTTLEAAGYEFEFSGQGNEYNSIVGIVTSQATGGILFDATGGGANPRANGSVIAAQFGKLTCLGANAGVRAVANRIAGNILIEGNFSSFDNNNIAGASIIFGDGTNARSGHRWSRTNLVQAGTTFEIKAGVQESFFDLTQVYAAAITPTFGTDVLVNNWIWHGRISWTPTYQTSNSNGSIGTGSAAATGGYVRIGKTVIVDFKITFGTSMSYGTGNPYVLMPFKSAVRVLSQGFANIGGTTYNVVLNLGANDNRAFIQLFQATTAMTSATTPGTWASGSTLEGQITFTLVP